MTWLKFRTKWREGTSGEWEYVEVSNNVPPSQYEEYLEDCEIDAFDKLNEGFRGVEFEVVAHPSVEWLEEELQVLYKRIENCGIRVNQFESMLYNITMAM